MRRKALIVLLALVAADVWILWVLTLRSPCTHISVVGNTVFALANGALSVQRPYVADTVGGSINWWYWNPERGKIWLPSFHPDGPFTGFRVPMWMPVLLLAAYPTHAIVSGLARRRRSHTAGSRELET